MLTNSTQHLRLTFSSRPREGCEEERRFRLQAVLTLIRMKLEDQSGKHFSKVVASAQRWPLMDLLGCRWVMVSENRPRWGILISRGRILFGFQTFRLEEERVST